MITKLDLDNWAESLGEVIAQRIVEMIAAEWMYHPYHFEMYQS